MVAERKRYKPETDGSRVTTLLEHDNLVAHTTFSPDERTRSEGTRPFSNTVGDRTVLRYASDERCTVVARALRSSGAQGQCSHRILMFTSTVYQT